MLPLPCELHDSIRRCLVNNFLRTVIDNPCNNSFTFKVDADGYFSTISKELRLARRLHGINGFRGEAAWCALGFGQIQICRRILVWIAVDGFDFRHKLHAPKLTLRRTTVRTHGLRLPFDASIDDLAAQCASERPPSQIWAFFRASAGGAARFNAARAPDSSYVAAFVPNVRKLFTQFGK